MINESATRLEVQHVGPLEVFESIATGFLRALASRNGTGDLASCAIYLDGADTIDGASYPRRAIVLAVEDLKQKIEAPPALVSEVSGMMELVKLTPVPVLTLYSDIATVILRMDAVFHLARRRSLPRN